MAIFSMSELLKNRMSETKQASELAGSDDAYHQIFQESPASVQATIQDLPLAKLTPFFTAEIGFRPYSADKLQAFADQLQEEGLLVRIIVRPMAEKGRYEILAGHNRVNAAKLAGWVAIPAEIVEVDDIRAIVIATSTNLIQRQGLSAIERGKAYKALLSAKNRNGQRCEGRETFGENRQRYNARKLVAEFFGVTEYEIRKTIKLTQLIPELQEIIENSPKRLNLSCADLIADYDETSQAAFVEICSTDGYQLNKTALQDITKQFPPPKADRQRIIAAWHEARAAEEKKQSVPPTKIIFNRKKFAPYLDRLGENANLEELFLEFLRQKVESAC